ncbi:hypothetical protein [Enterococcus pallens]|uniref:hypothetical protein n=1 Tax=Enterococcus pallens TaxID=160454 RepID=UPI0003AAA4D4|nr:hypothetical protein [Enterococcus pallens]OJG81611.1 hypothetical protein RV10_GL002850 [Enterococcus pallens]
MQYCGRGWLWYFSRCFLLLLIPCIGSFFFNAWIGGVLAPGIVLILIGCWLDSHYQGYQIQSRHRLCIQGYLMLTRQLTYVEKNKLQAFSVNSSLWMAKKGIGSVELAIKKAAVAV